MAVKIDQYEQRVAPNVGAGAGGSSGRAAVPSVPTNDAISANLLALSNAGGSFAGSLRDYENQKALTDAHVTMAQASLQAFELREQMKAETPDDPDGFTPRYAAGLDKLKNETLGKITNPVANEYARRAFATMTTQQVEHALTWESQQNVRFRGDQVDKIADAYSRVLAKDQTSYAATVQGVHDAIEGMRLPPDVRTRFRDAATNRLTDAASRGFVEQSPRFAQKLINDRLGIPEPEPTPQPVAPAAPGAAPTSSSAPAGDFDRRIMAAESGGNDYGKGGAPLTSRKGALYAMQVMPATAANPGFGIKPAADSSAAEYNRVGREYAAAMLREFGGDERKAAAAYNAGPGAVKQAIVTHGAAWLDHLPAETRAYVTRVTGGAEPAPTPMQYAQAMASTIVDLPQALPTEPDLTVNVEKTVGVPFLDKLDAKGLFALKAHADKLVREDQQQAQSELRAYYHNAGAQAERGVVPPAPPDGLLLRAVGSERVAEERAKFDRLQTFAGATARLQGATLAQMEQQRQALAPKSADDPQWELKAKQAEAYEGAARAVQKARHEDWIAAAGAQGIASVKPIDWTNPAAGIAQLAARQAVALTRGQYVADNAGDAGALTKAEAAQIGRQWQDTPPEGRLALLATLRRGLTDDRTFQATAQQFLPDRPESQIAAGVYMKATSATIKNLLSPDVVLEADRVGRTIERGADLLDPTKAAKTGDGKGSAYPMPSEEALYNAMPESLRQAFSGDPKGYQLAMSGIRAYYAAAAADRGHYNAKEVHQGALDAAVVGVTGGTASWRGGGYFVRPWGMDAGRAEKLASAAYDEAMSARGWTGGPNDQPERYQLVPYRDGQYVLSYGGGILRDATGPVVIDLARDGKPRPYAARGAIR